MDWVVSKALRKLSIPLYGIRDPEWGRRILEVLRLSIPLYGIPYYVQELDTVNEVAVFFLFPYMGSRRHDNSTPPMGLVLPFYSLIWDPGDHPDSGGRLPHTAFYSLIWDLPWLMSTSQRTLMKLSIPLYGIAPRPPSG